MWDLVAVGGVIMIVVGGIAVVRPIRRLYLPTRRHAAAALLGGLVFLAIGATNAQPPERTVDADASAESTRSDRIPADQVTARVRGIVEASRSTLVSITIRPPGQQRDTVDVEWRAPSGFVAARVWADLGDVLQAIHESGVATGGMVWVRVHLPARDTYGTETLVPGLNLLFDPVELQRVQWDTVRPDDFRRIAARVVSIHRDLQ